MAEPRWEREMQLLVREVLGWRTRPALASLRILKDVHLPWLERRLVLRARSGPLHVTDGLAPVPPA